MTLATTDTARVTFWDRSIKDRLDGSTLSHGQTAKRDLDRYHRLIADALPAIPARAAELLIAYHQKHRDALTDAGCIGSNVLWEHLLAHLPATTGRDAVAVYDLHGLHPIERAALLDASDRCIAHLDATPNQHLSDLLPQYFRISPKG